jgi:hypothetical protein
MEVIRTSSAIYQESYTELTLTLQWEEAKVGPTDPATVAEPKPTSRVGRTAKTPEQTPKAAPEDKSQPLPGAKPPEIHPVSTIRYFKDEDCARRILAKFTATKTAPEGYSAVKDDLVDVPKAFPDEKSCGILLALPEAKVFSKIKESEDLKLVTVMHAETQVPSEDPMYINVRRPIAGTASATVTLAANGTLTSAEASTDSRALEAILAAIPIADIVKSALGIDTAKEDSDELQPRLVKATLTAREVQRQYMVSVQKPLTDHSTGKGIADRTYTTPTGSTPGASIAIKLVKSEDADGDKKNDKAIQFAGSIALPEEKKDTK